MALPASSKKLRAADLRRFNPDQVSWALENLPKGYAAKILRNWPFWARDDQLPPVGDWSSWLLMGGRGSGKTRAGAEWVRGLAEAPIIGSNKRPLRIALVAPTIHDAREVMIEGNSGLKAICHPRNRPKYSASRRQLKWKNGTIAQVFSAEDADGLRGPQFDAAWADEFCAWKDPAHCFPALVVLDIPLLPGESERLGPRVAAFAKPWAGDVQVKVGSDQRSRAILTRPAIIGTVSVSLPVGGFIGRFDLAAELVINMSGANLLSVQESELLAGGNSLAVQHQDDSWEVLQYQLTELQADGSWVLSKLLRGQSGTENALLQPIEAGAQAVLLDGSTVPALINEYELGAELIWHGYYEYQFTNGSEHSGIVEFYTDQSRLPRRPVHLKIREMSGDYVVSWIRRTRIGGDNWNSPEVPLAESQERYSFSLFVAGVAVLSETLNEPERTITAAEIAGYFPEGTPSVIDIAVAQISAEAGVGSINRQLLAI